MARMTYLEIVRDVLLEVTNGGVYCTTIDESIESTQIAEIVKNTYYHIIDGRNWPHLFTLFQLTETSASTPTHFTISTNVMDIDFIKYNKVRAGETRNRYEEIYYREPKEFIEILNGRVSDNSNVTIITDTSGLPLNIHNDRPPQYYTSFDDSSIVMDSFDNAVETFLKTAKNQCHGKIYPTVTRTDSFIFDLPTEAFSYLLNESKSVAFLLIRNQPHAKAEQASTTQRRRMSWQAWTIDKKNTYPDFGRKKRK